MGRHKLTARWIALAALVSVLSGVAWLIHVKDCTRVETRVGTVPLHSTDVHYEAHGRGVAMQVKAAQGGRSWWINGKLGPAYAGLSGSPAFSPNGLRVGYAAKTKSGKMLAVVDDQPGPEYDQVGEKHEPYTFIFHPRPIVFSPDSRHVVYMAKKGAKWMAVRDGKEGPAILGADNGVPPAVFSPDSTHIAYPVGTKNGMTIALDDRPGPTSEAISADDPIFSPDSRRLAYRAFWLHSGMFPVVTSAGEVFFAEGWELNPLMFVDGKAGPKSQDTSDPAFSPDSSHCAYLAEISGKTWLVLDGKQKRVCGDLPADWSLENSTPVFSPDSRRLAFCGGQKGKVVVVVDDRVGPPCDEASGLIFSPDSHHFAYRAAKGGKQFVVADAQVGPGYEFADGPVYSQDSRHLAYVAGNGKRQFVVLDGRPGPAFETIIGLTFSPGSADITYCGRHAGKWTVMRGGRRGPWFDHVTYHAPSPDAPGDVPPPPPPPGWPQWPYECRLGEDEQSPYGLQTHRLAYVARQGKQWFVVIDGVVGPAYDRIITNGPYLQADGTVEFMAKRGSELFRVTVAPKWHHRLRQAVERLMSRLRQTTRTRMDNSEVEQNVEAHYGSTCLLCGYRGMLRDGPRPAAV